MEELIKMLDENLDYVAHEIQDEYILITVTANRKELICPRCNTPSSKVHSCYPRKFQDLPIQGKKVYIVIENRKMFCKNPKCEHKTFAESFSFLPRNGKRTMRLEEEIVKISLTCSSLTASKLLSARVANIGKTAICRLLKKRQSRN